MSSDALSELASRTLTVLCYGRRRETADLARQIQPDATPALRRELVQLRHLLTLPEGPYCRAAESWCVGVLTRIAEGGTL